MMAMEKVDLQVTKAFRNNLICDYCKVFPRPGVRLMRCIHSNDSHQCPILAADFVIFYYGTENEEAIQAGAGSE